MRRKIGNNIRLPSKTSLQLWKTLDDNGDINRARDTITENIKMSAKECVGHCEAQHHKPWFDDDCSKLVDRRNYSGCSTQV
jgi:hypothetical protein